MDNVRKTITISDVQASWLQDQIDSGQYADDSECIRDLIQREQERSYSTEAIRSALIFGEGSGEPRPFDAEAFKRCMLNTLG